jgi:hypothetical protein
MGYAHRNGKLATITPERKPTEADLARFLSQRKPLAQDEFDALVRATIDQVGEEEFRREAEKARADLRREIEGRRAKRKAQ